MKNKKVVFVILENKSFEKAYGYISLIIDRKIEIFNFASFIGD